jgi:hypothetical protein
MPAPLRKALTMKRIKKTERQSDEENKILADTMSGIMLLRVTSAVFVGMVGELVGCKLVFNFLGTSHYGVIEMLASKIEESTRMTKEIVQSGALANHPFAKLERNSHTSKQWFKEWAELLLHTLGGTLYMAHYSSEVGRLGILQLKLSLEQMNGEITTLRATIKGSRTGP